MSKRMSTEKSHATQNTWDFAIQACLNQIGEHEARAARLKTSLEYFETRRKVATRSPAWKTCRNAACYNNQHTELDQYRSVGGVAFLLPKSGQQHSV